jgi:type 1 glutamine amidotransferase
MHRRAPFGAAGCVAGAIEEGDMRDTAKLLGGVLGCFVFIAACGGSAAPSRGAAGAGGGNAPVGAAGATGTGGRGGAAAGAAGVAASGGASGGAGGDASATDAAAGASGSPGAPDVGPDARDDAAAMPDAAAGPALPKNVLIFTRSTNAYVHESKPVAAANIKAALAPLGVTSTLSEDTTLISTAGLAPFGAIVLVDASGKPFGDPGTAELAAVQAFVRAGGGLVAIHATNATTYDATSPYVVQLLGARYLSHPGDVRMTTCFASGAHPSVAALPPSFPIVDEIFTYDNNRRADSVVVVECLALDGTTRLPIAWHHVEGAGRVFNTSLGHPIDLWTPGGLLLDEHVVPGILWTLGLR